jgi:radical SAM superfamily enzyme YgiQ (UPF0313 family)
MAAGYAEKCGHAISLIDSPAWALGFEATAQRIEDLNPSLIVLDTSTPSLNNDIRFANYLKSRNKKYKIAMVGRGVSVSYDYVLTATDSVDFACLREYELTIAELADAVRRGDRGSIKNVKGIAYRQPDGLIVVNEQRPVLENLDEIPFVTEIYKRFLNVPDYFYGHSLHPLVVFDTSRGCPYHCSFCAYPQTFSGHRVRYRSVQNVADEFEFVTREMPNVKSVMLEDDTFIVNKKRTLDLANELIRRGNNLPFDSNCRVDIGVDEDFLTVLHKAGARLFCVGFESGSNDVIRHMVKNNKKSNDEKYNQTAEEFSGLCDKVGIKVHGCFMFGNLNETMSTMKETLDFALRLPLDTAQFYPIMIYPGTTAYAEAEEKGYINAQSYDDWLTADGMHRSVVDLPNLSHHDLLAFADKARRKFYLRPRYLFKKILQSMLSFDEFARNFKGFRKLLHNLISGSNKFSYRRVAAGDVDTHTIKFVKKQ